MRSDNLSLTVSASFSIVPFGISQSSVSKDMDPGRQAFNPE